MFDKLTEENFEDFAWQNYDNPHINSWEEFQEDIQHFLYLKKLLSRYVNKKELKERLILNRLIPIFNVFGNAGTRMLFFKTPRESWDILATFLIYLKRMPDALTNPEVRLSDLNIDNNVLDILNKV